MMRIVGALTGGHGLLAPATITIGVASVIVGDRAIYTSQRGHARTASWGALSVPSGAQWTARLVFIRRAQALGFSLTEIATIIALCDAGTTPCRHVRAVAQAKAALIDARITELQALREELMRLAARAAAVAETCDEDSSICRAVEEERSATP